MQPGASGQEKAQKETILQQFQPLPKSLCCLRKDLKSTNIDILSHVKNILKTLLL